MEQEPTYTCEVCNTPMVYTDIQHIQVPRDNTRPLYFCTAGCYYVWANGDDIHMDDYDQYR